MMDIVDLVTNCGDLLMRVAIIVVMVIVLFFGILLPMLGAIALLRRLIREARQSEMR